MATDSIFQIMSMTKNFTGVGIMMLVEEGRIELRRPVSGLPSRVQEPDGGGAPAQRQHLAASARARAYGMAVDVRTPPGWPEIPTAS